MIRITFLGKGKAVIGDKKKSYPVADTKEKRGSSRKIYLSCEASCHRLLGTCKAECIHNLSKKLNSKTDLSASLAMDSQFISCVYLLHVYLVLIFLFRASSAGLLFTVVRHRIKD